MNFPSLPIVAACAALLGALIAWLIVQMRSQRRQHLLEQQLAERTQQYRFARQAQETAEEALADSRRHIQDLQIELQELGNRFAAAERQIAYLQEREAEAGRLKQDYADLQQAAQTLQVNNERLHTRLEQERLAADEKLKLLTEARQSLGEQFQNLANTILEEKSRRFTEQNREHLGRLLNPLNERISGFAQLVQNTYEKEAKERLTLENELKRLQQLNNRLHDDANALTDALTGSRNKTQGNWGEMILESVLEHSGLQRGREYIIQASGTQTQEDGHTRRLQPDVLINLPDDKQIIIDSKVSLTAYVRYTRAENEHEARQALAAHVQSVRQHIKELAEKKYSDIDGLKTLDFVFMFIPVEPAYLAALQQEPGLFQECFDKRIMLAGPGTLLATLRTVANIWRTEQQNRNALAIADEGGRLYDKFVGFVDTLQKVGRNIDQAQTAYQQAFNQLKSGHGNLVNRAHKLHLLGLKTAKQLDRQLTEEAAEAEAETSSLPAPESGETENRE